MIGLFQTKLKLSIFGPGFLARKPGRARILIPGFRVKNLGPRSTIKFPQIRVKIPTSENNFEKIEEFFLTYS